MPKVAVSVAAVLCWIAAPAAAQSQVWLRRFGSAGGADARALRRVCAGFFRHALLLVVVAGAALMPAGCVGSAANLVYVTPENLAPRQLVCEQPPQAVRRAAQVALMDCGFTAHAQIGEDMPTWRNWRVPRLSRGNSPGHRGGCRVEADVQVSTEASRTLVRLALVQDAPRDFSTGRPVSIEDGAVVDRSVLALPPKFFTHLQAALAAPDAESLVTTDPDSRDPVIAVEQPPAEALEALGAVLVDRGFEVTLRDGEAGLLAAARVAYANPPLSWDGWHSDKTYMVTVLARPTATGSRLRIKTSDHHVETVVPEFARQLEERLRGQRGPAR